MRLAQLKSGITGPPDTAYYIFLRENIFSSPMQPSFNPVKVLPSNDMFTSDGT